MGIRPRQQSKKHRSLEVLRQKIRGVLHARNFLQDKFSISETLLHPEVRDRQVPNTSEAPSSAYAHGSGRISLDNKFDLKSQIIGESFESESLRGTSDDSNELSLS